MGLRQQLGHFFPGDVRYGRWRLEQTRFHALDGTHGMVPDRNNLKAQGQHVLPQPEIQSCGKIQHAFRGRLFCLFKNLTNRFDGL